jgi:hypothetical protein
MGLPPLARRDTRALDTAIAQPLRSRLAGQGRSTVRRRWSSLEAPYDLLHAMQFRAGPLRQVRDGCSAQRPGSDRGCPLDTARARCLWHAGGTADENYYLPRVEATAPSSIGG